MLAVEANPNLVAIIAAIPPTLGALAAFIMVLHGNKQNEAQHEANRKLTMENQDILIAHAARLGTVGRRTGDTAPPIPSVPSLSGYPQRTDVTEQEGGVHRSRSSRQRAEDRSNT